MKSNGSIALFNATRKELHEFDTMMQVEDYWRDVGDELVFVLEDYAFVDAEGDAKELAEWEEEDFIVQGWVVMR